MTVLTFIYEILLNLSIVCAPKRINVLLSEATFAINGGVLVLKTLLVVIYRKEIIEALEILNNEQFNSTDEVTRYIIESDNKMYCVAVQKAITFCMFLVYGFGSFIVCVSLCGLLLVPVSESVIARVAYFFALVMQIFVPGYLGSQLEHEGQQLVFAVYCSQWMSRKESFKRSLKLFMLRANVPIVMYGFKLFTISLDTFTKILKSAYSFAALVKNFMENEE
ncbi:odorant receptor 94a-like [Leptidea sinapis]|uniref:odorant receptor 94a-like n=1 Tax=Leptidea sinapis TaxID=189913 RepID=UPI0021C43267|nr:odorant receptor 94a-like [Leptidea sinapis]